MPKGMLLFSTTTKLLDFLRNHIVISHVHKQRNVCRTHDAPCLRLIQAHYHSNNITNNLAVTLKTWHVYRRLYTCIYSFIKVFNNLVDSKLSQITCSACLCLSSATDFSFSEKLSMNTTAN